MVLWGGRGVLTELGQAAARTMLSKVARLSKVDDQPVNLRLICPTFGAHKESERESVCVREGESVWDRDRERESEIEK